VGKFTLAKNAKGMKAAIGSQRKTRKTMANWPYGVLIGTAVHPSRRSRQLGRGVNCQNTLIVYRPPFWPRMSRRKLNRVWGVHKDRCAAVRTVDDWCDGWL